MEIRRVPRLRWGNPQITDKARFNIEEAGFVRGEPTDDGSPFACPDRAVAVPGEAVGQADVKGICDLRQQREETVWAKGECASSS